MSDNLPPLLPCPFCGNDKNINMANEKHDHSGGYFIACPACDASTGLRYAMGDDPRPLLVEQWNRRAAIEADLGSRDVPAGWVLVPVGPTEEMVTAGKNEYGEEVFSPHQVTIVYRDMLAASPPPQPVHAQPSDAATLAIEALEAAKSGLDWYRGVCPQHVAGDDDDDEMDQQIEAAIAALQGKPAEQAQKEE